MRLLVVLIAPLLILGCSRIDPAMIAQADDAKCKGYGAAPGSDVYIQCRMSLDNQRATDLSMRRAAILVGR